MKNINKVKIPQNKKQSNLWRANKLQRIKILKNNYQNNLMKMIKF